MGTEAEAEAEAEGAARGWRRHGGRPRAGHRVVPVAHRGGAAAAASDAVPDRQRRAGLHLGGVRLMGGAASAAVPDRQLRRRIGRAASSALASRGVFRPGRHAGARALLLAAAVYWEGIRLMGGRGNDSATPACGGGGGGGQPSHRTDERLLGPPSPWHGDLDRGCQRQPSCFPHGGVGTHLDFLKPTPGDTQATHQQISFACVKQM